MVLALVPPEQAVGLIEGLPELKRHFLSGQGLKAFELDAVPLV